MQKIHAAILNVMREIKPIKKEKQNTHQGYKFRGIDDMYNFVHPLFAKHGIFVVPELQESSREVLQNERGKNMIYSTLNYKYTFYAEDGSNISVTMQGEAMDYGDKSSNKAASAALKYALMQILLIPTEDLAANDPDFSDPKPVLTPKKENNGIKSTKKSLSEKMFNQLKDRYLNVENPKYDPDCFDQAEKNGYKFTPAQEKEIQLLINPKHV